MSSTNIVEKMLRELQEYLDRSGLSQFGEAAPQFQQNSAASSVPGHPAAGLVSGRVTSAGGRPRLKDLKTTAQPGVSAGGSNVRRPQTLRERLLAADLFIGADRAPGQIVLNDWQMALESALRCFRSRKVASGLDVQIAEVDLGGGAFFEVRGQEDKYGGFFYFDSKKMKFGMYCNCDSITTDCEHSHAAIQEMLSQLKNPGSFLEEKLMGSPYEQRKLRQQLERLQRHIQRVVESSSPTKSPEDLLTDDAARTRYQWNLEWDAGMRRLQLRPVILTEKKAGGWSKGREQTLETFLCSSRDAWSALDRSLADMLRTQFDYADALRLLQGTDSFLLHREPAVIEDKLLEVFVEEEEQGLRITTSAVRELIAVGGVSVGQLISTGSALLLIAPKRCRVVIFRAPQMAISLVNELNPPPLVSTTMFGELLPLLRQLSTRIPVHMPSSVAGPEIAEKVTPAVLMCLRRNAGLDLSLVMEDSEKKLHFPGEGELRRFVEVENRREQLVRDPLTELRLAEDLRRKLNLGALSQVNPWIFRTADPLEADRILADASQLVSDGQLKVLWHADSANRFNVIGRVSAANVRVSVTRQRDWFGLQGSCRIGDSEIPLKDLLSGLQNRSSGGLVEVSPGKWALMAEELRTALTRLADVSHESRGKLQLDTSAARVMTVLENAEIRTESDKHWKSCLERLAELNEICPDPPAGLAASLRDYQVEGFRWLSRLSHWGIGGILADDMGLGKTVQTLALLMTRVETGPTLVIAPTSLGFNWQRECERFTPSLRPILFRESDRPDLKNQVTDGDLVICSYGLALREAELLKEIEWGTLVLDEAQNVKNSASKTAAAVRGISAKWKLALTGTPMENHLGELWSIFHTIAPGVLGSWEQFRRRFAGPIEKERNPERRDGLSKVISPFVLRRSKSEVLKDLPARTETNLLVDLTPEERQRYDRMRLATVTELDALGEQLSQDQRFRVLQMLTRLRQLACHVRLVDESWEGSSSKLQILMERLEQLKERGSRPLVFSQFTSHLALISKACDEAGISYQYLDGQTTPAQRQQRVEAFQNGEGDAFLISLKAGGTGLNLTAADYVIHMDPWWNPAVEDQATDRTHRIGQTKPVMVYRIIARGTIEEQILALHEEKRDLVDGVLAGADAAARLSTKELAELIRQGPEATVAKLAGAV